MTPSLLRSKTDNGPAPTSSSQVDSSKSDDYVMTVDVEPDTVLLPADSADLHNSEAGNM